MKRDRIAPWIAPMMIAASVLAGVSVRAQDIQVVHPTNTVWTYNDSSISTDNPTDAISGGGTRWMDPAYVPVIGSGQNQWKTGGRGLFGNDSSTVYTNLFGTFGNGFRTPLNRDIPGVGTSARVTFYFITKFNWPYTPNNVVLRGTNWLDDGGVVYLNGVEVFRARQPGTPGVIPAWSAIADNQANEGVPEPLEYSAISLVTGENTLAVEVHQSSTTSSDLAFTTALRAVLPAPPTNTIPSEPSDRSVLQNRSTTFTINGEGNPRPTYQWYFNDAPISGATSNSYSIVAMQDTNAGLYKVVLANEFGRATSRVAQVTFIPDTQAPVALRAIGSAGNNSLTVEFSEALDQTSATDAFAWSVTGAGILGSPVVLPGGDAVQITLDAAIPDDTLVTVSFSAIKDLAGNEMAATNLTFRSWVTTGAVGLNFEVIAGLSTTDNSLAQLTNSAKYPNNPDERYILTAFNTRQVFPTDAKEGYGGRVRGLFVPPRSGKWRIYSYSDDSSSVFMNTNGPAAGGKSLVAYEPGCCNPFRAPGPGITQTSEQLDLIGGQGYYIEAIYKEGTGGDYLQVGAKLDVDPTLPANITPMPADWIASGRVPPNVVGPAIIVQQPASRSVSENTSSVTFSVVGSNVLDATISYQWQRSDGGGAFTDIAGAVAATYSVAFPTIALDNGDQYRCLVQVPGSASISDVATLTVTADTTAPVVTRVLPLSATSLVVYFSEPPAAATDAFNFELDGGVGVSTATLNPTNLLRVDITTAPMTVGALYTLTVKDVTDRANNSINPNPTIVAFRVQVYPGNPDTMVDLPVTGVLPLGALTQRGILGRLIQIPGAELANVNELREQILAGVYPSATNPATATVFGGSFIETNAINYDRTAATNTAPFGHITPDLQFPGFPVLETEPGANYDNMTMEAICYVQLQRGIVRMGVNSDDGFSVTPALSATDPGATNILGQFNGGRGSGDTEFAFFVPQDGLYPFRLMWEQGGGGANVEWWVISDDGTVYQPINSATNGPAAFVPPCSGKSLTAGRVGLNLLVSWPDAGLGHMYVLQQSGALGNPTVWSNAVNIPQLIGGSRTATVPVPASGNAVLRLHKAGPPCN